MSLGKLFDDEDDYNSPSSRETRARWAAEYAEFKREVEDFATLCIPAPETAEDVIKHHTELQRQILRYMILSLEPGEHISPPRLADELGIRNRRYLRDAARRLNEAGLLATLAAPAATAEGQHVEGYFVKDELHTQLHGFVTARHKTVESQATEAIKQ